MIEPDAGAFALVDTARSEWVLTLTGKVVARTPDTVNPDLPTGEVELRIESCAVQGRAQELPMPVFGDHDYPEETRLTYRFLDLRRPTLQRTLAMRHRLNKIIRDNLDVQAMLLRHGKQSPECRAPLIR